MVNYDELPLFPLQAVLYPGLPLPLHIFEERYREMIAFCRANNTPFGIVLIQSGSETGGPATPYPVGTIAKITHVEELSDGRLNIVVLGESRFRILETRSCKSYLTAIASPFAEPEEDGQQLATLHGQVSDLFKAYLRAQLALNNQSLSAIQLPREATLLSYAVANAMQIPLEQKQQLLEITSTAHRLDTEMGLLVREIESQGKRPQPPALPQRDGGTIQPVDTSALRKLTSRN